MIIPEKMNERIRYLRLQHGYTQQEIINILGIGKSVYSMYESGERTVSVEIITKLARFYNVSTDFIIGLSNNTKLNNFSLESHLSDEAFKTIVKMSNAPDNKAMTALNALLADKQCCKLFDILYKVLHTSPERSNSYYEGDTVWGLSETEKVEMAKLKDLFGLSGCSDADMANVALDIGVSERYLITRIRNIAKILFMAQIESFIDRNTLYKVELNRARRGYHRKE